MPDGLYRRAFLFQILNFIYSPCKTKTMTILSPALLVMIVRIIVYMVQQTKEANLKQEQENQYKQFLRQVEHPAEYFLRQPRSYSYQDYMYYYRN